MGEAYKIVRKKFGCPYKGTKTDTELVREARKLFPEHPGVVWRRNDTLMETPEFTLKELHRACREIKLKK